MLDTVPVTGHGTPTVRNGLPCLMQYFPTSFFSHRTCVTPSQNSNMLLTSVLQKKNWSPSMMEQQALSIISKQICTESINQLVINGGGVKRNGFQKIPYIEASSVARTLDSYLSLQENSSCKAEFVAWQKSIPAEGERPNQRMQGKKIPLNSWKWTRAADVI